jgi:hypothetical protein
VAKDTEAKRRARIVEWRASGMTATAFGIRSVWRVADAPVIAT